MKRNNFGIITSISWNSNNWEEEATDIDIYHSNFNSVKNNEWMHEDLNFGHEKLPCEADGTYIAYTPMFNKLPAEIERRYVQIVFFRSLNYISKRNLIVGFYAFPKIGRFYRAANHHLYYQYDWGNVMAKPENIVRFSNPIEISNDIVKNEKLLPEGKKLSQQGFNYLYYENVLRVLDKATTLNPNDKKTKGTKFNFLKNYKAS